MIVYVLTYQADDQRCFHSVHNTRASAVKAMNERFVGKYEFMPEDSDHEELWYGTPIAPEDRWNPEHTHWHKYTILLEEVHG